MSETTLTQTTVDKPWLKHYDFWVPASLTYPRRALDHLLDTATMQYPDNVATVFFGEKITYRELSRQVNALAATLQAQGIQKGDRIAMMLPNCPQFVIAYYAILRLGAIVVNVNPLYTPREIGFVLNEVHARAVFMLDQGVLRMQDARAAGMLPALEMILAVGIQDYLPEAGRAPYVANLKQQGVPTMDALPEINGIHKWADLLAAGKGQQPKRPTIDPEEDVAIIQFTGGTTGTPKGAMLTHFNIMVNTLQIYMWGKQFLRPGSDVFLTVIPLFHVYGMTVAMNTGMLIGAALLLVPRFDPTEILSLIQTYKPSYFPGVPTMYIALLNHPKLKETDISSLRLMNSGSAPLPRSVFENFQLYCSGIFTEGFGLSEASPVTHSTPIFGMQKVGAVGLPLPDTDAKIVHIETGQELPVGESGELILSGPQVMKGYYNKPEETANVLRQRDDGKIWLQTGDIARMDKDGYFEIVDRKKDLILVSGFNVYPRDVEEVLYSHSSIQEAAVIGEPHAYTGETVKAFVVLKANNQLTDQELIAYCRERLAGYKTPTAIVFRDSLPKTVIGKVSRVELRKGQ